ARETFPELHDRLAVMGAELLVETLKSPLRETPQDERAATICRKLSRKTGDVDPLTMTAEEIDRKVRALNPWPGVRCAVDGTIVKLLRTSLTERPESVPLGCRESVLHLLEVQPEGRTAMTATEWMRGKR
ncbi:methionyl-tRNA formyltransferase, partial [Candidatus Peregrinibacteria bacterium]|nr:methionyl-tRNA formyltransferase [Candidatus Peregrinibacteria bacterium]